MAKTPLNSIINSLLAIPEFLERGLGFPQVDTQLSDSREQGRIVLINDPEDHDSGGIKKGIPIYNIEDIEKYPYRGEGLSLDVLAYYISYHYGKPGWGIYILRSGVYKIANALIAGGYPSAFSLEAAQSILLRHEMAHFQTDLGITSIELVKHLDLYIAGYKQLRFAREYHKTEEGLANSLARRSIAQQPKNALDNFLNSSPDGYQDWAKYKIGQDPISWKRVLDELLYVVPAPFIDTELAAEVSHSLAPKYFKDIPVYEVFDIPNADIGGAYVMGPILNIEETASFKSDLTKISKGQPRYRRKWEEVKTKLSVGHVTGGVHLELINKKKSLYSVRIDKEARAGLNRDASKWTALAAGHHDELYRRLSN